MLRILADSFALLTVLSGCFGVGSEGVSEGLATSLLLFQPPSSGLFCRSDVLENSADVFESLPDVFELSSSRVFCLVLSVGETFEAVGSNFQDPGHQMDYVGTVLEEHVAGSKAVGAEGKAIGKR